MIHLTILPLKKDAIKPHPQLSCARSFAGTPKGEGA